MNTIDQAMQVRKALKRMLKVYTPYEGKNLNRYKNLDTIKDLYTDFEENPPPFEFNGVFSGVVIDHTNVDLTRLKEKLNNIENIIHALDLFESSYLEEYKGLDQQIKTLVEKRSAIERSVKDIPSYMLKDLIK